MKRRSLLAAAAFAATLPFSFNVNAQAADATIRVHHFLPAGANIPKFGIQAWADKVMADSDGRIDVQVFPAMQLGGKPPELYQQVQDGVGRRGLDGDRLHARAAFPRRKPSSCRS